MGIFEALVPFMLVLMRVSIFLFVAPPFSNRAIPWAARALLAAGLALVLYPTVTMTSIVTDAGTFITRMAIEAFIGAGLGFLVMAVFAAVGSAGRIIDLMGGFQVGAAFDPMTAQQSAPFGRLFDLLALVLLFVSDGYQLVVLGLARTLTALPPGGAIPLAGIAETLANTVSQMMVAALQIAGPLIAVLLLADIGLGLLTRVAPALNAFAMGFPLKILITLSMSAVALAALPAVVSGLTGEAMRTLLGVVK